MDAPRLGASVLAETDATWVVITAGASGAVALSRTQQLAVPAFRSTVRHTHCAGAAFSGGLLYGLLHDWPMGDSLGLACASGALRCERAHHEPMPALAELRAFMDSRERIGIPAA
jgi:sugar/nucleoside kinase (ribokinase family)